MQLFVTFSADRIALPIASNQAVQGLIYRVLSSDPAFSEFMHESGNVADGRAFKLFNFSELSGRYETDGREIVYFSEVRLEIRSANPYFITLLFTYFTKNTDVTLGSNTVKITSLSLGDTHVFSDCIKVRTLSPITVYITCEDKSTVYFSPYQRQFCNAVEKNARRKWLSMYGKDDGFSFTMKPCKDGKFFKRATRFKNTFITAWHGTFFLEGTTQTLDFLYHTGLGSKNSQGFGMFEVLSEAQPKND